MESHQLAFSIARRMASNSKLCSEDKRLPPAAIFDQKSQTESTCCAVCLDDICGGDSYRELAECRHLYHSKCIDAWLESHSTCPLCRTQIPQIISLNNQNHYPWNDFLPTIWFLALDFLHKISNPLLNDDLTSMLCGNFN